MQTSQSEGFVRLSASYPLTVRLPLEPLATCRLESSG